MRTRWIGVVVVVVVAAGVIAYKHYRGQNAPASETQLSQATRPSLAAGPQVVLVANLSEANEPGDNCAEIIHLVGNAGKRGIKVQELSARSHSPLIKRYHVLTIPTLLILHDGRVVSRYEGESGSTVKQIRNRLVSLRRAQP